VSVPIHSVEEGSALTGDGRILCLKCRAPAPVRGGRVTVLVLALAALAAGVAVAFALARR